MSTSAELPPSPAAPDPGATPELRARVIGVGGAGGETVAMVARLGLPGITPVVLHTNRRYTVPGVEVPCTLIGPTLLRGLGTGGDPDLGQAAAEEALPSIHSLWTANDLVFLVAGLGGGTGGGAGPVVARAAKETGCLVIGVAILPFDFEGSRRRQQALEGLRRFKAAADVVLSVPNQKALALIDENANILRCFEHINRLVADGIRGLWQMLTRRGLIQVDFAHLAAIVRGRHTESAFATVRADGENRSHEVVRQLASHPLLSEGRAVADAGAILVNLVAGADLTMTEVDRVIAQINRLAPEAQLMVGASIDPSLFCQLEVTVVAAQRNIKEETAPDPAEKGSQEHDRGSSSPISPEIETDFFAAPALPRPASRFVPPPPQLPPERAKQLLRKQRASGKSSGALRSFWKQGQLPLEIISKGRFEKSEPTIYRGDDLDVPTYVRRGVPLN